MLIARFLFTRAANLDWQQAESPPPRRLAGLCCEASFVHFVAYSTMKFVRVVWTQEIIALPDSQSKRWRTSTIVLTAAPTRFHALQLLNRKYWISSFPLHLPGFSRPLLPLLDGRTNPAAAPLKCAQN
jgi:hypothetical protein